MKNVIWYLVLICFSGAVNGQDPHFSQPFASPLQQNPALTGLYEGDLRAGIQYRQQWSSVLQSHAYKTYAFGAEKKFFGPGNDFFNFGMQVLHDESGTSNFERNEGHLAFSYQRMIAMTKNASHFISAGVTVGGGQIKMDNRTLWFSSQYNPNQVSVNIGADNGEPMLGSALETNVFVDISIGGMYYGVFGEQKTIYVGGALFHANNPSISFDQGAAQSLFSRYSLQAGGEFRLTDELSVLPAITFWNQGPYLESNFGGTFRYQNSDWDDIALRLGPTFRYTKRVDGHWIDAIILESRIEFTSWSLGLSYDINVSSLNLATRSKGALEFSLIFKTQNGSRAPKVKCPKF